MFFQIIFLLLFVRFNPTHGSVSPKSYNAASAAIRDSATPGYAVKSESIPNSKINDQREMPEFQIHLPFMDMEVENNRNLVQMQERSEKMNIFLLHGSELFQMFVDAGEKRLSLIGYLGGSLRDAEPLSGEVIIWHDFLVFAIAMDEYIEVYQLSTSLLEKRATITKDPKRMNETAPTFEPIQEISLPGKYRQHFLTDPDNENIMLVVGINFTKLYGRLHTYLWLNTYFEPIEELTVPPIHSLQIIGSYPKYLIRGRIIQHQTKTIITIYKIESPAATLHAIQTITADARVVHAISFRGRNYIIACASHQKQCISFRMNSEGHFNVYKQRSSQELAFDKLVGGKHFIVASRRNQVLVYTTGRLDCYGSFVTNETDVTSIRTLVNANGEDFIILNYKRSPLRTLIRFVQLEYEISDDVIGAAALNATEIEDSNTLFRHRHLFEETIGMLRSLLLRRTNAMNTFWKIPLAARSSEVIIRHPLRILAGNIKTIKIANPRLVSPLQLLAKVSEMRKKYLSKRGKRESTDFSSDNHLRVKHLKVTNLNYDGSILKGFHWDKNARPMPILSVRPKITTSTLTAKKLLTNRKMETKRKSAQNTTSNALKYKSLNVESINGVPWRELNESLFLKNRNAKITGNLILQAPANVKNLMTPILNEVKVENYFNLMEPQVVQSNIDFSGCIIRKLHAETINGLDFANDIVFGSTDSVIESPVNMYKLSIGKDLVLADNVTVARSQAIDQKDFEQHYTGKVIINGSLTVKNIETERAARVSIDGMAFSKNLIEEKFLLRNQSQNFNSNVVFGNAKLTVPKLSTNHLNSHPTEEHLMANESKPRSITTHKTPIFLVLINARIEGDLESRTFETRIANLSRNVVRRGLVANITGFKSFEAPLTVDHVMTLSLNQMPVTDLVLKSQLRNGFKFDGEKSFANVKVQGATLVYKDLNATNLNKLPTMEMLNNDLRFNELRVPFRLLATNIVFGKINNINFDDVFSNFKLLDEELVLHKELIIDGNISFRKNIRVKYINGIDWSAYQAGLVRRNDDAIIAGRKSFLKELTVTKTLIAPTLNELNMENIFRKILSKSRPQAVDGKYSFGNMKLTNVDVGVVNGISTAEFIDVRSESQLIVNGDLIVPKVFVKGNITITSGQWHDLAFYAEKIRQLSKRNWKNVVVTKNAYWHDDDTTTTTTTTTNGDVKTQNDLLAYLYDYAVQRYGRQLITGNVRLLRPFIKKMKTKATLTKEIDFDYLVRDCVLRKSKRTQIISGKKTFIASLHAQDVQVKSHLSAALVNDIDVVQLNNSIYYLSNNQPVTDSVHFITPPKIGRLIVRGLVNGISPSLIYWNDSESVPPIQLKRLTVKGSLNVSDINDIRLDELLRDRIRKNSSEPQELTGILKFENLVLSNKAAKVQSINGIPLDKLVLKRSNQLQTISGAKNFVDKVILTGPVNIVNLNDENLVESYQQSIFINRNYHHSKLRASGADFEKGLVFTKPAGPMLTSSTMEATKNSELSRRRKYFQIESELHEIDRILDDKAQNNKNLLYLDYTPNWHIIWGAASPNDTTIQKTLFFEHKTSTLCERKYIGVQISRWKSTIFLSNFTTTNLVSNSQKNISVKAENYCHYKYRKVKSKITISGVNFTRIIGMKKYIKEIIIYAPDSDSGDGAIFVLLHAIDLSRKQNEVRILKIITRENGENNITDWQSLNEAIGSKTLRLFEHKNFTALMSGDGIVHNHPALAIYHFDYAAQKFMLAQTIDGDFDIHKLIALQQGKSFQLILSCRQCQHVHVYNYSTGAAERQTDRPYKIFQILKLKTPIDRVQYFSLADGSYYLLFLPETGQSYFYLYKFSFLHGWLHTSYGYFENVEMALPLTATAGDADALHLNESNLLTLLCGESNCSLLRAVVV